MKGASIGVFRRLAVRAEPALSRSLSLRTSARRKLTGFVYMGLAKPLGGRYLPNSISGFPHGRGGDAVVLTNAIAVLYPFLSASFNVFTAKGHPSCYV